jgi:hypothetical protein
MTIEQSAAEAVIKIRPRRRLWIWYFVVGGFFLGSAAFAVAGGRALFVLLYLGLAFSNVSLGLVIRTSGVDLTPEFAIVPTLRRRRVRWLDVQAVVSHKNSNGTSAVRLILANGEPVTLRYPRTLWRNGDAQYEHDFQRIEQWWLANRGEHWHPVRIQG